MAMIGFQIFGGIGKFMADNPYGTMAVIGGTFFASGYGLGRWWVPEPNNNIKFLLFGAGFENPALYLPPKPTGLDILLHPLDSGLNFFQRWQAEREQKRLDALDPVKIAAAKAAKEAADAAKAQARFEKAQHTELEKANNQVAQNIVNFQKTDNAEKMGIRFQIAQGITPAAAPGSTMSQAEINAYVAQLAVDNRKAQETYVASLPPVSARDQAIRDTNAASIQSTGRVNPNFDYGAAFRANAAAQGNVTHPRRVPQKKK